MREVVASLLFGCLVTTLVPSPGVMRQDRAAEVKADNSLNPAEFERLREEGNAALYNLEYQTARERFQQMTRLAPDHPAGYVYLASTVWLEILNASRRLSASLYSSTSFYSQIGAEDKVDPDRQKEFTDFLKKALETADARLKKAPNHPESLYYKAAVFGLNSAYTYSIKRSWRRAIGDAKESVRIQNQVLRYDKNYTDAYLNIGLYEYIVGSLPFFWSLFARLVGIKGSKQKGIDYLEMVGKNGKYAQDDARVLLIAIYSRENQPQRALDQITFLATKYPRNYLLGVERAAMLYRMGRRDEGARVFDELIKDGHVSAVARDVVNYQYAEAMVGTGNYATAIQRYKGVIGWPDSEAGLVTLAHLRTGQALQALGRHAEAVTEYEKVLKRPNVYDVHERARKFKESARKSIDRARK